MNCFELSKTINTYFRGINVEAVDSFQIAVDDAAYSHGSDHALGTQWMLPLGEIKAGKFQVADNDHWCPS